MGVAHAMAQALGGRYGLPHGTMNALCLPVALRFNAPVAGAALARLGDALATEDVAARAEQLAAAFTSLALRDHGVPREELGELAELAAARPAARGNPRAAGAAEILELYEAIW